MDTQFKKLHIHRHEYGDHKGKLYGSVTFDGARGTVELPLTDALANRIICACADDIILASKQVADELTADVLEGTLAIPDMKETA